MKKLFLTLLLLAALLCGTAFAAAPGETVSVSIRLNSPDDLLGITVNISYDSSVLQYVSGSNGSVFGMGNIGPGGNRFVGFSSSAAGKTGTLCTLTFKVKDNAPAGTYRVSASVAQASSASGASASVSGGSVTVEAKGCTTHTWDGGKVTKDPTCTAAGVKTFTCTACGETKTESVQAAGHKWDKGTVITAPSCTQDGYTMFVCQTCGEGDLKTIPSDGAHTWDAGVVTKPATCTATGLKTVTCTSCKTTQTQTIPAGNHDYMADVVKPTCTEDGYTVYLCASCGAAKTADPVPATGHKWDAGKVTTPATCSKPGQKTVTCTVCKKTQTQTIPTTDHNYLTDVTKPTCTEGGYTLYMCLTCGQTSTGNQVPATGHKWDAGKVVTAATCSKTGLKSFTCTVCKATKTESIPTLEHTASDWIVTKPVTDKEPGEEQKQCIHCGKVLQTRKISNVTRYNMTVSSMGPRFRDVSRVTDKWHMFTVVDLSQDGVQTFDLVAGNIHIIGTMTVTVKDGYVTISTNLVSSQLKWKSEYLSILPQLQGLKNLRKLNEFEFDTPISIADDLDGDTLVMIYMNNACNYRDDVAGLRRFDGDSAEYAELVDTMMAMLDAELE